MPKYVQKFQRGQKIRITDKMPSNMAHFESDCEAIVEHTYKEIYGGGKCESKMYSLYILVEPDTRIIDVKAGEIYKDHRGYSVSWYEEDQLTLIDADTTVGLGILKKDEELMK